MGYIVGYLTSPTTSGFLEHFGPPLILFYLRIFSFERGVEGRARVKAVEGDIVDEMLVMGGCCVREGGSRG